MNETMDSSKELVTFSFVTRTPGDHYQRTASALVSFKKKFAHQENEDFQRGLLLETMEKGVTYPMVHRGSIQNYFQKAAQDHGSNLIISKGCYQELEKVQVDLFGRALDDLGSYHRFEGANGLLEPPWSRFFIVLGFKQLPSVGKTEVLENHWKDWTGARYLYLNLPDEFGPIRITFYKRFTPDDLDLFLYLVVAECIRVIPSDVQSLQDFVMRMRADKMPFYLALYRDLNGGDSEDSRDEAIRWSSGGSAGFSSPVSSMSEEMGTVTPRMSSTPIFGSPVPAYQTRVTFVNF